MRRVSLIVLLAAVGAVAGCSASSKSTFTPASASVDVRNEGVPATKQKTRLTRITIGGQGQDVHVRSPSPDKEDHDEK